MCEYGCKKTYKEEVMATVPNWIANAVIYESLDYGRRIRVIPTTGWRATKTQVIVTYDGPRGPSERRFRLEDLGEVGRRQGAWWHSDLATLADPSEDRVVKAQAAMLRESVVGNLKSIIDKTELDASEMDAEALAVAIDRIHSACSVAIIELGELAD
jgi:hypothetical protein